jgi:hypothetical protein
MSREPSTAATQHKPARRLAVEPLRRAVDCAQRFRLAAADDSDFDPIRDDPAFKELVGR